MIIWRNRLLKIFLFTIIGWFYAAHTYAPINLTAVDIARHLKNGQLILAGQTDILYKNVYSFTHPEYPFINHHWLFGVLSWWVYQGGDYPALGWWYIIMILAAVMILFEFGRRWIGFRSMVLILLLAMLPITDRREIRPEVFSYFFISLYLSLMMCWHLIKPSYYAWIVGFLVVAQVLWVNTHIFFFLGPLIVICAWGQACLTKNIVHARSLMVLIIVLMLASLINPSGWQGALIFLNGFKEFGYRLAENQHIWFMLKRFSNDQGILYSNIYWVMTLIAWVMFMLLAWRRLWVWGIFFLVAIIAGFGAIRLMTPMALVSIWMYVLLIREWYQRCDPSLVKIIKLVLLFMAVGIILAGGMFKSSVFAPKFGFFFKPGLIAGINQSAEFFKGVGLKGPVMSNYDIGGYLIYHLYPQEKVFVDNRQEAFPVEFFKNEYIPIQEDNERWQEALQQYQFNVIYYYRHDLTPWGQQFLINRIDDPQWAPVYVDGFTIIYARRGSVNQPIIDRYELPRSMFSVSPR